MTKIPAVFMRGGTSKGVFFHARDLPADRAARDAILIEVLGSPDAYQRQLNGLGGGVSSLSKAAIVARSERADADVDYTFAQIVVDRPEVDYSGNCGNLSSAVGPFAVEERLVAATGGETVIRIFNTNTQKLIHAKFETRENLPVERGDFEIAGVSGTASPISLTFPDPGGSVAKAFLPTGQATNTVRCSWSRDVETSMVDATNPVVFARASDFGIAGVENPDELEANSDLLARLEELRRLSAVSMGLADSVEKAGLSAPKIALIAEPATFVALNSRKYLREDSDVMIRMLSMGRMHRAVTLTGAMCLAAACKVNGSLANELCTNSRKRIRIGHPSGIVEVDARVESNSGLWSVRSTSVYRTARRLMEGHVILAR